MNQCKEIEENNRMVRLEIYSQELEISRKHFIQGWGRIKDKKDKDLTETKENKTWQEYTEELYKKGFMT